MDKRKRRELLLTCIAAAGAAVSIGIRTGIQKHRASLEKQLYTAILRDDADLVIRLLDQGVSMPMRPRRPKTHISAACSAGAKRVLVALLHRGEHPGADDVAIPALRNDAEMVEILIKAGANPNATAFGRFPLMFSLAENRQTEMMKWLMFYGADPNVICTVSSSRHYGFTPLMVSISGSDMVEAQMLLNAGARVDARVNDRISDLNGYTPLMIAVQQKARTEVALLLKYGARTDTIGSDGATVATLAKHDGTMLKMLAAVSQAK